MAVKKGDAAKHVKFSDRGGAKNTTDQRGKKSWNEKRDRKPQNDKSSPKANGDSSEQQDKKSAPTNTNGEEEIMLEQILALGGSKGDLKFLKDIDTNDNDDLVTSNADTSVTLQNELKSFMVNIGLTSAAYEADLDDAQEEQEDDDNEEEESEDEESVDEEQSESDEEETLEQPEPVPEPKTKHEQRDTNKLIVDPTPQWYNVELSPVKGTDVKRLPDVEISQKYKYARDLLEKQNAIAETHSMLSTSDRHFMSNMLKSGTVNDKVSALILLIQESPLHGLKPFDMIMAMTKKKSKKEAEMATKSLKDLFIGSVMPDRKLSYFADRPLGSSDVTDKHLLLWIFEDHLKKTFFEFVTQIEVLSHDTLLHIRYSMVNCLHDLLVGKPEQEQNLLKLLVNKLGDAENKVSAKASQMLVDLLVQHPGMKMYVVRELEQLILRTNVSERAQYYSIITANQIIFTGKDTTLANKLIDIYFFLFRNILHLSEQEEKEAKILAAKAEKKNKPARHRNKGKDKAPSSIDMEDRHAKTLGAVLTGVNRAFHFADIPDDVFDKHMEVLFKITHAGTFNMAIQSLNLISSIAQAKPKVADRFYRTLYESMLDTRLLTSSKHAMYLNLLFRSIRADHDLKRIKAFAKRMVQIASHHRPTFICGLFFILSQLMKEHPGIRAMLISPEEDDEEERFVDAVDEDDEEERFVDAVDEDGEENKATEEIVEESKAAEEKVEEKNISKEHAYDGRKRDPRYSNAEKSCLWELIPFKEHYHPTVAKYAEKLFNSEPIEDQTDLRHHTLIHFLDRFVYRNPKKQVTSKGSSMMQPLVNRRDGGVVLTRSGGVDPKSVPLNSELFWRQQVEQVPVEEVFFHKYFSQKAAREGPKEKKRKDGDDDEEDEVWRAMMASMPGEAGDSGDDSLDDEDEDEDDDEMRALLLEDSDNDESALEDDDVEHTGSQMGGGVDDDNASDADEMDFPDVPSTDEEAENEPAGVKRRAGDGDVSNSKKKKQKRAQLPTFASYEDYAKLLDQED